MMPFKLCCQFCIFITYLTLSRCRAQNISEPCVKHLYKTNICMLYTCDRTLDPILFKNEPEEEDLLICQLEEQDIDENRKNMFPIRFQKYGNQSTTFFQELGEKYSKIKYCYDSVEGSPKTIADDSKLNQLQKPRKAKICTEKKFILNMALREFQKISSFVSPIFIFLPIVIFILTREIQNAHGWTHFTNGCCVFALYISWGLRYILFRGADYIGTNGCVTFGVTQHYFHLSVFSWLVVACHDLQKLSEAHPSGKSLDTRKQIVLYMKLSLFGWGIPAFCMGFCEFIAFCCRQFGMDVDGELASYFLPEYGKYRCFLAFNAYWLHLILPTLVLFIIANVFNWRTLKILRKKNDQSMEHAVQKVNVIRNLACLRATMLASICWGCDVARSFMTAYDRDSMLWLRVILDTLIYYQTIPIFVIYSCRPHILNHLEAKYPAMTFAIELSRTYFRVKRKEVDPDVVTQLRVHKKGDVDATPIPENCLEETAL